MPWLPDRLPERPRVLWRKPLTARGLSGIAATRQTVIVPDRDLADAADVFHAFDASTGRELWTYRYPAPGKLDYGNAPRATPLIDGDRVFLFGAFGHLSCVDLKSGKQLWHQDLRAEFDVTEKMPWGLCGSPLIADGRLLVYPGGRDGALVALEPETGELIWQSPGRPAGYGSFLVAELGGRRQVVGHDAGTLGGWDLKRGERLWTIIPPNSGDFNVPTPIVHAGRIVVSTENNGTRLFQFRADGQIEPEPAAVCEDLAPDTHTPVVVGNRLLGVWQQLYCLDLKNNLAVVWKGDDRAFQSHVNLIASPERILISTDTGELMLVDAQAEGYRLLSRLPLFANENGLMSHPAIVDRTIYVRGGHELLCVALEP